MQIITFANNKGGVGKTTSALAVAHELSRRGSRVLLIDADPQANASATLPQAADAPYHLGDVICDDSELELPHAVCLAAEGGRLDVVPASRALAARERVFGTQSDHPLFFRSELDRRWAAPYDFVVIDTAPSLGPLTAAAMVASDAVFVPTQPDKFGTEGLAGLLTLIGKIRKGYNPKLRVGGIFFTKYAPSYRRALHHQYARALAGDATYAPYMMETTIRENVALQEAQHGEQPVQEWAPDSNGATDYRLLTNEILSRLNEQAPAH